MGDRGKIEAELSEVKGALAYWRGEAQRMENELARAWERKRNLIEDICDVLAEQGHDAPDGETCSSLATINAVERALALRKKSSEAFHRSARGWRESTLKCREYYEDELNDSKNALEQIEQIAYTCKCQVRCECLLEMLSIAADGPRE